ncbi:MAG: argininosuccinate lyase, partial [Candidatus Acidiferrales bacterium]
LALDRAWAKGLERARLLSADECSQILRALDGIVRRAKSDAAWLDNSKAEDVHHFVEIALIELLGPVGAKLHTGRSRNEMVATEFRMFVKEAARAMAGGVAALVEAIAQQAERNLSVPMAGMTHMQHAQPILLSHFLLAHAEAFLRDGERILSAAARADVCPLGSGALAGCAFPVDREALARELGFSGVTANSLDAVSDRDFALEYLFALSVLATHLSRLSEDFVLFASTEFSYVTLPDEFSTGSSLMPQKKNPDAWELIRGKSGRISSALVSLLMTMKGLPTSYQRDLQEDKEPLFDAHDEAMGMVRVAAGALAATKFNEAKLRAGAANPALLATEAADYLVARGVPFREAHEIVGRIVREAELQSTSIVGLSLDALRKHSPAFATDYFKEVTLEAALARKSVPGGTSIASVRSALDKLHARAGALEAVR